MLPKKEVLAMNERSYTAIIFIAAMVAIVLINLIWAITVHHTIHS